VLFGSGKADRKVRELLLTACDLQAVIALPSGVFKPYSGVATAIFIFQYGKPTESVWFYEVSSDGYSLDDKRTPIEGSNIPDILVKWPSREEGPNSFRVPVEKIRENNWQLMPGRYKPRGTIRTTLPPSWFLHEPLCRATSAERRRQPSFHSLERL
jgi:type I restriction enzyme M protein